MRGCTGVCACTQTGQRCKLTIGDRACLLSAQPGVRAESAAHHLPLQSLRPHGQVSIGCSTVPAGRSGSKRSKDGRSGECNAHHPLTPAACVSVACVHACACAECRRSVRTRTMRTRAASTRWTPAWCSRYKHTARPRRLTRPGCVPALIQYVLSLSVHACMCRWTPSISPPAHMMMCRRACRRTTSSGSRSTVLTRLWWIEKMHPNSSDIHVRCPL